LIKNEKYYAIFSWEVEEKEKLEIKRIPLNKQVGIDLNTSAENFITLAYWCQKDRILTFYEAMEKRLKENYPNLSQKRNIKEPKKIKHF